MTDQFTTDIGTAFVYGVGFAAGVSGFVLVVVLLTIAIVVWMGRKP